MASIFPNAGKALGSKTADIANKGINKLPDALQGPARAIADKLLPGLGGQADFSNNSFANLVNKRMGAESEFGSAYDAFLGTGGTNAARIKEYESEELKESYDWRARLRPKKGGERMFYGLDKFEAAGKNASQHDYLMKPIFESGGLIWQYTPSVYQQASAEYSTQGNFQGSNYPINTFVSSRPADISVTGEFTCNDQYEARYFLAMQMFLKVATKAHFGDVSVADGNYGMPPPVLLFEYLGDHGFNKVPVVVTNYSIEYARDVDYVPVVFAGTTSYVPTKANVSVALMPMYTPHKLRKQFDIESIASGLHYKGGFI